MSMGDVLMSGPSGFDPRGSDRWMDANQSSSRLFEKSKIKVLQDEREAVQKKTFTKWVNSHLQRLGAHVNDLYHDLQDGRKLILLLEILSGEKLPKPSRGRMRIHFLENCDHALKFLKSQRVHLENIGSHDIVDGNSKITLGLIWTIILRFQIQDIMIETDTSEKKSAKEALLLWCQTKTAGYRNVKVTNFTKSWSDGLAFAAMLHKYKPDKIDFDSLKKEEPIKNLNIAFDCAEQEFDIAPLLDAPDVSVDFPDEKSIMTYVASFYHCFAKLKKVEVSGTRIQKVIKQTVENEKLIQEYETLSSTLLIWIQETIVKMSSREFGNTFAALQQQMADFNVYRTKEKPPKFIEKGNLEVKMFEVTSSLRMNHQKMYVAEEDHTVEEINKAWAQLEKAEHEKEVALRNELIRQERLEQKVERFYRKSHLRESWLSSCMQLLTQAMFGNDLPAVKASIKKHEAIESEISAYKERVLAVESLAEEIEKEGFYETDKVNERKVIVMNLWEELLTLLSARSSRLLKHQQLHKIFQEMINLIDWMEDVKVGLLSEEYGKHFTGVEDLLQKHMLVESDIQAQNERVKQAILSAEDFLNQPPGDDGYEPDVQQVKTHQNDLQSSYDDLCKLAEKRKQRLEESLQLHSFYRDAEEEDLWLSEKEYFVSSTEYGKDVHTTMLLLKKHEALESELVARKPRTAVLLKRGDDLLQTMPYAAMKIEECIDMLTARWDTVEERAKQRKKRLQELLNLHQYLANCNEITATMDELDAGVSNEDLGHDEASVEELLKKHKVLVNEIENFEKVIDGLEEQRVNTLAEEDQNTPEVLTEKERVDSQYAALKQKANDRNAKLEDTLALYKLYNEADMVRTWVTEHHVQLETYLKVEKTFDLEQCQTVEQRFEGFEQELRANQERLNTVNRLASELSEKSIVSSDDVAKRVEDLNGSWEQLNDEAQFKKEELHNALEIQTLYSEIVETQTLIIEKSRILQAVEEVGTDLASVITLQRRLNSIERDIVALQNKLHHLESRAATISEERPEDAATIQTKLADLMTCWDDLSTMVKQRNESLAESGELKRFVMDLDEFHNWLMQTQAECASEDIAQSLQEAESLLEAHSEVKANISQHEDDFNRLCEDGPKFTQDESDLQQQSLKQQLDDIITGWREVDVLWARRQHLLEQSLNYQIFLRDSKQAEALLAFQELFISRHEVVPVVDAVLAQIKKHEDMLSKLDQHDEKVNHVVNLADQLIETEHYASDKIKDKIDSIKERRRVNRENLMIKLEKLQADLKFKQFLQDTDDVTHWLNDRLKVASEEPQQELTNLRSRLTKHQAFEMELQANKKKIESINEDGKQLMVEDTDNSQEVETRLETIDGLWTELNTASVTKSAALTEAHREEEFNAEVSNVDTWVKEVETTITETETGTTLTSVKAQYTRHKVIEKEIREKRIRMIELSSAPGDEVDGEKLAEERRIVEERFEALEAPLAERRIELEESFNFYQFQRDIQDEHLWIDEKEPVLKAQNFGTSLHEVLRLKKRHQTIPLDPSFQHSVKSLFRNVGMADPGTTEKGTTNLCKEIEGHEPIVTALYASADEMANNEHPRKEEVVELKDGLVEHLAQLKGLSQNYQSNLDESLLARQYFHDAAEAESWMSEQELYMIGDDRGKDEIQAQSLLNKHINLEKAVDNFKEDIDELHNRAQGLVAAEHPESAKIETTQANLEKGYDRLKELAEERHSKLDENLKLYQFNREIEDLEAWINEKEVTAGLQDIGQDFDHVQMLEERFDSFSNETQKIGRERVENVNAIADQLIGSGHSDAATIAEWKDGLNDSWANLLELLETRKQLLLGAHEYHRFFQEAKQTLMMIQEKESQLGEDLGRDQQGVYALQRYHRAFEADLQPLGNQVGEVQKFADELKPAYAGDRVKEIEDKEGQVVDAWHNLLAKVSERGSKLGESDELQRFVLQIHDLLIWIRDMRQEIASDETPKIIPECQTIMDEHQGRKSEMDAREEKIASVLATGEQLIENGHYATSEIQSKINELREKKGLLEADWEEHWDVLNITLEVMHFARDAQLAEEWIVKEDLNLYGKDKGDSLDIIEKLLEKQSGFEKLLAAQEERFVALENLTTYELRQLRKRQLEEAKREKEEQERLEREQKELERIEAERELQRMLEEQQRLAAEEEERARSMVNGELTNGEQDVSIEATHAVEEIMNEVDVKFNESELSVTDGEHDAFQDDKQAGQASGVVLHEGSDIKITGYLSRKHTMEGSHKKASQRTWKQYFVSLRGSDLAFHREEGDFKKGVEPVQVFDTTDSRCEVASNYHKKKFVFRIKLASGSEYLLQAKATDELSLWIQHIRGSAIKSGHLPEDPSPKKKGGRFSLKKK